MKSSTSKVLAAIAALAIGFTMSSCTAGGDTESQDSTAPEVKIESEEYGVTVLQGSDLRAPETLAIICVRDSAFLYVFASGVKKGGPALSRFSEQDASCADGAGASR